MTKEQKAPTMNDVARIAGVTQATVSYVLNNSGGISQAVRERVLAAAKELGYIPNAVARNLKTRRTNTIGVLVSDVADGRFAEPLRFIEFSAREQGYCTFLCNTQNDPVVENAHIVALLQQAVAGVVFCCAPRSAQCCEKLRERSIPFVFLGDEPPQGVSASCVTSDERKGSLLAVSHLHSLGISDIAFCSEPITTPALADRHAGFLLAMERLGLQADPDLIRIAAQDAASPEYSGAESAAELLRRHKRRGVLRPLGIVISAEWMAFGVVRRLRELRVRIPEDVSVVTFGNSPFSSVLGLSSVQSPVSLLCEQGIRQLFACMKGGADPCSRTMLDPILLPRESAPPLTGAVENGEVDLVKHLIERIK